MTRKETIERDAGGQFAKSRADARNDGVISAVPTSVTGCDDATLHDGEKKPGPKPGFDIRTQTNHRD
jgi:hypothetical protein